MAGYRAFIAKDDNEAKYRLEYFHNPQRWNDNVVEFDNPIRDVTKWSEEIKYLSSDGNGISDEILNLPNNIGGIYMFYIKGVNLPFVENHILYIGRCKITEYQNIKKRAKEYYSDTKRQLIVKMFRLWEQHLYYRYFQETDNDRIDSLEVQLIRSILPPLNEAIPNRINVQPTVPAFNN